MKRLVLLAILALVTSAILAPVALAQEDQYEGEVVAEMMEEQMEQPQEPVAENAAEAQQPMMEQPAMMEQTVMGETTGPLSNSGGLGLGNPSVLFPATVLLLGSGLLAFAALRHREHKRSFRGEPMVVEYLPPPLSRTFQRCWR